MQIEFASPQDESAIKALLAECRLPFEDINPNRLKDFLITRDNGLVVGIIGLERYENAALLRSLAVREVYRGQGLAGNLVRRAEEYAQVREVEKLFLLTETAEKFFIKQGFKRVDRKQTPEALRATTEFKSLCPVSAVCMVKALKQA